MQLERKINVGIRSTELTLVDYPPMDDRSLNEPKK
nr:MAG TPA: hypothetical protein [Ackermannviridae sp.]